MQRDLTKLWLAQKGHERKLTRLERLYEHLKNEPRGDEEESRNLGITNITYPPELQEKTNIQKSGDTGTTPEASPAETEENSYDDDLKDSEEDEIDSWYSEEEIPDIAQG